jgi:hypothetical protein
MRVKTINRSEEEFVRERSQDLRKVHKNLDPALHPFEKAVEYKRAVTAAKLDRWPHCFTRLPSNTPCDNLHTSCQVVTVPM